MDCHFNQLKDKLQTFANPHADHDDDLVDFGFDEKQDDKELLEFDFYYDCEGVEKEVVQRAIELLNERYYINRMLFMSVNEDGIDDAAYSESSQMQEKMPFNPVIFITEALLECQQPTMALKI